ncbi:MAG TPA: caspase family protein [Polyangiaceae bacterium]|nr:caspase family protein [Polyangiaceae bacterium]
MTSRRWRACRRFTAARRRASRVWFFLLAACVYLSARDARASVARFAVLIGNNTGASDEAVLRYAENDAARMGEALKDVGGFPPQNVIVLRGETATTVERAIIATNDRVRAAVGQSGTQVVLFVYFSGHADAMGLHLAGTRLELDIMEQLVRSSAAAFRVLVLDACRSGSLTRVKGGAPAPPFLLRMQDELDNQGAVFLTSSASHEDAQESDEIGGSFFSHYFRSGLLGAADDDDDGKVTLEEAYAYAYRWTLSATSRTWAGTQHPTYRYDVRGRGGIVMTEPRAHAANRSTAVFPPGRSYLIWQSTVAAAMVGEVAAGAAARTLSLKPGRYLVRARARDHLLEGEVTLRQGETLEIRDDRLQRVEYARLVRKGGSTSAAHGPLGGYAFHTALRNAASSCQGAFVAYPIVLSSLALVPRFEGCKATFDNSYVDASVTELGASVEVNYNYDLPIVSLRAGVSGGPVLSHQSFVSRGRAPARTTFGGQMGVSVGGAIELRSGFYLFIDEALRTYWFVLETGDGKERFEPSLAFQQSLGIGKYW